MTLFPTCRRWPTLAFVVLVAACGGDGDPAGPEPVAQVTVSAPATVLEVGGTTQLAVTLRDAAGAALTGRTITYASSATNVATVSDAGVVTAVAPGSATITATSEGRSGTVQITVQTSDAPSISGITPATLQAGQSATITGSNFSTSPASNIVTVGGERLVVTAATVTSLTVTIPSGLCLPSGTVAVVVRVGSQSSAGVQHPVQTAGTPLSLPVGQLTLIESATDLCLRFAAAAANESYSFGVQSTSASAETLTPVTIASTVSAGGGAAARVPVRLPAASVYSPQLLQHLQSPAAQRWAAHRAAEARLRAADRRLLPLAQAAAREQRATPGALSAARAAAAIPADVAVGDTVTIRVPDLESVCASFTEIRAVARVIGQRGVWLDDVANPANGLDAADFQTLSQRFDSQIYATNVEWFGQPTDKDANSRVVIVSTKEVNNQGEQPPLGFVTSADLVPRTQCASSDFGEIYYGRAADPAGEFGPVYPDSAARQDAVQLISHEFTHIIQFGRRIDNPQATTFPTSWELEGQATFAEEVNGHAASNRTNRQNYGFEVAWTGFLGNALPSPYPWYADAFFDLLIYYGLNFDGNNFFKTANAPEQCSWLGREDQGNTGPCVSGREIYGVPWSFLRFLTDHYAAGAGGGPAFHRALIDANGAGFPSIANVLGVSIDQVLAEWSASLWVDDRFPAMAEKITFPSWNLVNIIDEGIVDPAHLTPRARTFSAFSDQVQVRGGSTAYYTIGGAGRPATYVRFRNSDGGQLPGIMQVWVVRTN